jgi:ankyrin repeat protein
VDASIPEKDGYTPLHGAGFQGRAGIARLLLLDGRNLDPSHTHRDGFQPLHRACWGEEARHAETVRVLVEEGGVPWDAKGKGKTCLQITQNSRTKQWLREWGRQQEL